MRRATDEGAVLPMWWPDGDGGGHPTFFVTEAVFEAAMPRLRRVLRPGGWLVLGRPG
jgi:hypothetical protein